MNYKKLRIIFLFFIISQYSSQAQLLWKISGNGLNKTSYLLGTHHLISIQFLDSIPSLYKSFNECETVIGELNFNKTDVTMAIQQAAAMDGEIKINDLINKDDYQIVDRELKSTIKMGLHQLARLNPTLIQMLYQLELYKQKTGFREETQSDSYLQMVATEKGKQVIGLETVDQQIELMFKTSSLKHQASNLVAAVKNKETELKEIDELNQLYKQGKIEELYNLTERKDRDGQLTDEEHKMLIDKRNASWIKILQSQLPLSSCFIAVGAAHLGGKSGLIQLLQKKGYNVTPAY